MSHVHSWKPLLKEAIAYYSKRDEEIDAFVTVGMISVCSCAGYLFIPNDKRLTPVEAELAQG